MASRDWQALTMSQGTYFSTLRRTIQHTLHASSGMYSDVYSTLHGINSFPVKSINIH
jgi:hypothetical protein